MFAIKIWLQALISQFDLYLDVVNGIDGTHISIVAPSIDKGLCEQGACPQH